jgi:hypothetical protein
MYGETPRQGELVRQEMVRIEETQLKVNRKEYPRDRVRPVAETLIRVSQRGADHVQ